MPRDLTGCGRYPPQPRFHPFAFYSAARLGDPEVLARIMQADPYFITQDNGAGAPLHFAVTYKRMDMVHHLLNNGAAVNQRDTRGFTPLHRAAYLAHLEGYLEMYELLLSHGADPAILSEDFDPYLDPGRKSPRQVASKEPAVQEALAALDMRYADVAKAPVPHPDIGDWWALYDYGPETVASWPADYVPPYPEVAWRAKKSDARKADKAARRIARDTYYALLEQGMDPDVALGQAQAGLKQQHAHSMASTLPAITDPPGADTGIPLAPGVPPGGPMGLAAMSATTAMSNTPISFGSSAASGGSSSSGGPAVALLFPGQGSQALGMLREASTLPAVQSMLSLAQGMLGYDLLEVCLNGPKERLDDTAVAQPALYIAGLAAAVLLQHREEQAAAAAGSTSAMPTPLLPRVAVTAGLSLGEYSALVWAGGMSFEDGLKVVKARGEAMADAARAGAGIRAHGMLSVVGLPDATIEAIAAEAVTAGELGTVCQLANYLFPTGRVVSGHLDALEVVHTRATAAGALKVTPLAVSGAFHTPLMAPASERLMQALASVDVRAPRVPVLSNVTGKPFPSEPAAIKALLARQLVEPVQWESTLRWVLGQSGAAASSAISAGSSAVAPPTSAMQLAELGPGQQIKAMVKRLDLGAWRSVVNVAP